MSAKDRKPTAELVLRRWVGWFSMEGEEIHIFVYDFGTNVKLCNLYTNLHCVLVCSLGCNKVPRTGWFININASQFWRIARPSSKVLAGLVLLRASFCLQARALLSAEERKGSKSTFPSPWLEAPDSPLNTVTSATKAQYMDFRHAQIIASWETNS